MMNITNKQILLALITAFTLSVLSIPAVAEHKGPQALVSDVVEKVLDTLKTKKERLQSDPEYLRDKVEELVLANMDFVAMSKLVIGKHWRKADDAQREQFTAEFRKLLVRTYTKSLSAYSDETIVFLPFREGKQPEKRADVRSEIVRSAGPSIPITYKLRFKTSDGWKVYDIAIEGISLVTNYRSSFSRQISQKGIAKLIESLVDKNTRAASVIKAVEAD